ncbi:hypothetical protein KKF84_07130 [Myxococcota bacterium]|nr:hypothetical protein [Myxococcota bacterium]
MAELKHKDSPEDTPRVLSLELVSWEQGKVAEYKEVALLGVTVPWGEVEIFYGHIPTIFLLRPGLVRVHYPSAGRSPVREYFAISSGVMTVDGNQKAVILAPEFVTPRDVDEADIRGKIAELEAQSFNSSIKERLAYENARLLLCQLGEDH